MPTGHKIMPLPSTGSASKSDISSPISIKYGFLIIIKAMLHTNQFAHIIIPCDLR